TTPTSSRRSPAGSARRWSASTWRSSPRSSGWPPAAGERRLRVTPTGPPRFRPPRSGPGPDQQELRGGEVLQPGADGVEEGDLRLGRPPGAVRGPSSSAVTTTTATQP